MAGRPTEEFVNKTFFVFYEINKEERTSQTYLLFWHQSNFLHGRTIIDNHSFTFQWWTFQSRMGFLYFDHNFSCTQTPGEAGQDVEKEREELSLSKWEKRKKIPNQALKRKCKRSVDGQTVYWKYPDVGWQLKPEKKKWRSEMCWECFKCHSLFICSLFCNSFPFW